MSIPRADRRRSRSQLRAANSSAAPKAEGEIEMSGRETPLDRVYICVRTEHEDMSHVLPHSATRVATSGLDAPDELPAAEKLAQVFDELGSENGLGAISTGQIGVNQSIVHRSSIGTVVHIVFGDQDFVCLGRHRH